MRSAQGLKAIDTDRLKEVVREYGLVAICIQVGQFTVYFIGLTLAILAGWQPETSSGNVGALGAALGLTLLFKPVQVAITIFSTPFVARWLRRGNQSK